MSNWITLSQNSGTSGTTIITVSAATNNDDNTRSLILKAYNSNRAQNINITQDEGYNPLSPYFTAYYDFGSQTEPNGIIIAGDTTNLTKFRPDRGMWTEFETHEPGDNYKYYGFTTSGIHRVDYKTSDNETVPSFALRGVSIRISSVVVPGEFKYIGSGAFSNINLKNITLNSGLLTIGTGTFISTKLSSITIPDTVTSLEARVFAYCNNLHTINCYATTAPNIWSTTFGDIASSGTLHYPAGSNYSAWLSALGSGWTGVADL